MVVRRADVASEALLEIHLFICLLIETSQLRPLWLKACYQLPAACYKEKKKEKKMDGKMGRWTRESWEIQKGNLGVYMLSMLPWMEVGLP